jgi:hypothetical protein
MNTEQRVEFLKISGILSVLEEDLSLSKYLDRISAPELITGVDPTFTARDYDLQTLEYVSALLLDCHFGAKSKISSVSSDYLARFEYVADWVVLRQIIKD